MTYAIEEPYATGRGRAFRFWPTRWALVVGWWAPTGTCETEGLMNAVTGRNLDTAIAEIKLWNGSPSDEIPEELWDTEGVISYVDHTQAEPEHLPAVGE